MYSFFKKKKSEICLRQNTLLIGHGDSFVLSKFFDGLWILSPTSTFLAAPSQTASIKEFVKQSPSLNQLMNEIGIVGISKTDYDCLLDEDFDLADYFAISEDSDIGILIQEDNFGV